MLKKIFPVEIYHTVIDISDEYLETIKQVSVDRVSKNKKFYQGPYLSDNSYSTYRFAHTLSPDPENKPPHETKEFKELHDKIMEHANIFWNELDHTMFDCLHLKMCHSWVNINGKGGYVVPHQHYASTDAYTMFSGAFYINRPEPDGGDLMILDPLDMLKFQAPGKNWKAYEYEPIEVHSKHLVLFPSWLKHTSVPNQSDENRIVMSFDISVASSGFNQSS